MRVLLLGTGPLPHEDPSYLGFPQLRTHQALLALLGAGHEVELCLVQDTEDALRRVLVPAYPAPFACMAIRPQSLHGLERLRELRRRFEPDVVVTAGPYEPARLGPLVVEDEPLWVDVPGDPFAEAQAKQAHQPAQDPTLNMRAAYAGAYARADAFGVISHAQRHALLGQLGWLGRLGQGPVEQERVFVVPAGMDFGTLDAAPPRVRAPESDLVVALSGGYNTWLDADTLLEGLLLAMRSCSGLRVVSTGGAIEGHHNATYEAFRAQALSSPFGRRFTFHGWVPHSVLPGLLSRAHLGVCLDRPGYEPELGTRTRVVFFLHQGLDVVATPCSDLTRELAGIRMIAPVRPGDPEHLAEVLVRAWREGSDGSTAERGQAYLQSRYGVDRCFRRLLSWVDEPARLPAAEPPSAGLAAEVERLRAELDAVYTSPTWRAAGRAQGILKRGATRVGKMLGSKENEEI